MTDFDSIVSFNKLTRPDGRLEAYDIPKGQISTCSFCRMPFKWGSGQIVLVAGHYFDDGEDRMVCTRWHLPENDKIVIFNPETGMCRTSDGQNEWREK